MATNNNFTISAIESDCDYVHLLIDCTLKSSIPSMIKDLRYISNMDF
ncbi:transposase (plasmid) [Bacillus mycoides]|nr:transposase [Bacillus mycoides]